MIMPRAHKHKASPAKKTEDTDRNTVPDSLDSIWVFTINFTGS